MGFSNLAVKQERALLNDVTNVAVEQNSDKHIIDCFLSSISIINLAASGSIDNFDLEKKTINDQTAVKG